MSEREKRDGAIRIFEALSGVDEKYLEACERDQGVDWKNPAIADIRTKKVATPVPFERFARFNRRYGKFVAAALIFCVVGVGYLGLNSLRMGNDSAADSAKKANYVASNQGVQEEAAAVAPETIAVSEGAAKGAEVAAEDAAEYIPEVAAQSGQTDGMRDYDYSESRNSANSGDTTNSGDDTNSIAGSAQGGSRDQSSATKEGYLPKVWPQGCVVEESSENGVLTVRGSYPDTKKEFILRIGDQSALQSEDQKKSLYDSDSVTLADVEKELTGGSGAFAVRYQADGFEVVVQFSGDGEAKEIWKMVDSIQP